MSSSAKTKDIVPMMNAKSALEILREERDRYEQRIQQQKNNIVNEFLKCIKEASELYQALVSECNVRQDELLALPEVSKFLYNFEPEQKEKKIITAKRINSKALEEAILKAISAEPLTHASIQENAGIVDLYQSIGKSVPSLQMQLKKLIDEKKVTRTGELREAKYGLPRS